MSYLVFLFGLVLSIAGAAGLIASVDLVTTELGLLYALCGSVALSGGVVTLAIGVLVRRVEALGKLLRANPMNASIEAIAAPIADNDAASSVGADTEGPPATPAPEAVSNESVLLDPNEQPVNENRAGKLPTLAAIEKALAEPEAAPTLVGRYASGGSNYKIFSDGSIEAETDQGAYKFASMNEFKDFIAAKRI
jgi:hypothetical protein